jgi:hypothetical protein
VSLDLPCTAHAFFPERLSNHCQGRRRTNFEICTESDAALMSGSSRNRNRPDTRLKLKYHLPLHLTTVQTEGLVPEIMNTILYFAYAHDSQNMALLNIHVTTRHYIDSSTDNWMYTARDYASLFRYTYTSVHRYTYTSVHGLHCRCSLLASRLPMVELSFLWVPKLSPCLNCSNLRLNH